MRTEKEIIDRLRKGHHDALTLLMSKYQGYVYSILKSMLFTYEAEEATQDTFIKIFKNIDQYNGQSKLTTWMYSIAYRTGLDYLKKRKSHKSIDEVNTSNIAIKENTDIEYDQMKSWINQELSNLDATDATLLRLYYLNEYSIQEVTEITGLSPSNVKVKLFRSRNMLKKRLSHLRLTDLIN